MEYFPQQQPFINTTMNNTTDNNNNSLQQQIPHDDSSLVYGFGSSTNEIQNNNGHNVVQGWIEINHQSNDMLSLSSKVVFDPYYEMVWNGSFQVRIL